jgi:hypothetical protein
MRTISRLEGRFFIVAMMLLACVFPRALAADEAGLRPPEASSARGGKQWLVASGQWRVKQWSVASGWRPGNSEDSGDHSVSRTTEDRKAVPGLHSVAARLHSAHDNGAKKSGSALRKTSVELAALTPASWQPATGGRELGSALPKVNAFAGTVTLTEITDTVYRADGSKAKGTVLISWPAFTTATQGVVAAGALTVQLGPEGLFDAKLAPTTGSNPTGVYYRVVYQLDDGSNKEEYWAVPATDTTTISAVRAKLVPANVAAQFMTRDLADSSYVHADGDQTVNGVKTFAKPPIAPDPRNATDVANKEYVDANAGANLASPPPIGNITPNAASFTVLNGGIVMANTYSGGIAAACASLPGGEVLLPAGSYQPSAPIACAKPTRLRGAGMNQTIIKPSAALASALFAPAASELEGYSWSDMTIDMTNVPAIGVFSFINQRRPVLENVRIIYPTTSGSGTAIYKVGTGELHARNVIILGAGICVDIQGDGGQEDFWTDIVCESPGNLGYRISRTTPTDVGGQYLTRVKITNPDNRTTAAGIVLTSTAPSTVDPVFLVDCMVDNVKGGHGFSALNWREIFSDSGWYTNSGSQSSHFAGVYLENVAHAYFDQGYVASLWSDLVLAGSNVEEKFYKNQFTGTNLNFATAKSPAFTNVRIADPTWGSVTPLSDADAAVLAAGGNTAPLSTAGGAIWTRNDGGNSSEFCLINKTPGGTNPNKCLRVAPQGQLELLNSAHTTPIFQVDDTGGAYYGGTVTVNGNLTALDVSPRDIPGHEYFVSKFGSIQATINAAYGSGTVSGTVIDDRTAPYSGPGFYIPDSVKVQLAPVPYVFTSAVTHNNGNNNVTAAIIVDQGAHLAGGGTSSNHGTTITVGSGFANDIVATTSVGTGTGAGVQWWHWGSIENLNVDGGNQTAGECIHVENMGETSKVRDLLVKNCYSNNVEFTGAAATQSDIANVSTSRSRNGSGVRFTNLSGLGKITGLSGDCNAGSLVSVQENAAGTLTIAGLKSEAESTICANGAAHDPVVLLDTLPSLNTHVHIIGGYAFGTAQNAVAKVIGTGGGILEMEGFYVTGYTNLLNDMIRSVVIPATNANSKQPFYYEPNGIVFANQAFTLIPGTGVMGGASSLTPIFYATTGNATMVAPIGNGDGQSIMTGGVQLAGQNRINYGATPEAMARAGYRFTGSAYDTTKWDFVPAWNSGDTTEKNLGNSLNVCQKNGSLSCRWSHVYGVNVDALVFTLGTYTVAALPGSYGAGSLAWVSDGANLTDCTSGHGSSRVLCFYSGSAWTALTSGNGTTSWGSITGTMSNQTDLQTALNGKAAANASTTINGVACALGSSCAPDVHLIAGTMVGPQSGIIGNGSDQNVFNVTIPAGAVSVGTGFKCSARFAKTATSNSITFKWLLGATLLATQSVTSSSANWTGEIEVFTPSSLSSEVANVTALIAGTTIQAGPQVGLTASENMANAGTLKLTFNAPSSETITPKTFYCTTVQ